MPISDNSHRGKRYFQKILSQIIIIPTIVSTGLENNIINIGFVANKIIAVYRSGQFTKDYTTVDNINLSFNVPITANEEFSIVYI